MVDATSTVITGRCVCEDLRYELNGPPLFTHTCHCLDCQRKTGTAFAMTTIVLRDDLVITHGRTVGDGDAVHGARRMRVRCAKPAIYVASTRYPATADAEAGHAR